MAAGGVEGDAMSYLSVVRDQPQPAETALRKDVLDSIQRLFEDIKQTGAWVFRTESGSKYQVDFWLGDLTGSKARIEVLGTTYLVRTAKVVRNGISDHQDIAVGFSRETGRLAVFGVGNQWRLRTTPVQSVTVDWVPI